MLVGVGAARRSSAVEASLWSGLSAAPSLPTLSECQELENKHVSIGNGFAIILQLASSPSFDFFFFVQDPKSSRSYPHALNLLSWKFHENSLPHDFLLFHAFSLDGKLLWEQPLLLISGTCLIFVAVLYCVWQYLHAQGQVMGTVEKRDLKCFWILNYLFQDDDARLCNFSVFPRAFNAACLSVHMRQGPGGPRRGSSSALLLLLSLRGSRILSHYYIRFPILI